MKRLKIGFLAGMALLMIAGVIFAGGTKQSSEAKRVMTAMFLGSSQDQAVVDIIKKMTDQFNANNPYNVEFRFETYENEQYKTKLTTVMASNSAPDVFFTWSAGYLKPFVEGGKVYEIGKLIDADPQWKGRFNDGVFGPVTYNGKVYAVMPKSFRSIQTHPVHIKYIQKKLIVSCKKKYSENIL
jgi:ABC-type glycerol-3-phosphate transport system substrate-binding protein